MIQIVVICRKRSPVDSRSDPMYVATDTDDTYFLGSIFCESPVDENSCNDNSRDCGALPWYSLSRNREMLEFVLI